MERHLQLLAALWLAAAGLGGLVATSLAALALAAAALGTDPWRARAATLAAVAFGASGAGVGLWAVAAAAVGVGLRRRRGWAPASGVVLAVVSLPAVPFGTALGLYALWVLLSEEIRRLFARAEIG
jgi:hypothetical protein